MTANQVAFAGVQVAKSQAEETERHNRASEEIELKKAENDRDYKEKMAANESAKIELQKEYNLWYERYTEATTEEKLRLEGEGVNIEQQLANIKEWESRWKEEHDAYAQELNRQKIDNDYQYQTSMANYKALEIQVHDKAVEYEKEWQSVRNALTQKSIDIERKELLLDQARMRLDRWVAKETIHNNQRRTQLEHEDRVYSTNLNAEVEREGQNKAMVTGIAGQTIRTIGSTRAGKTGPMASRVPWRTSFDNGGAYGARSQYDPTLGGLFKE